MPEDFEQFKDLINNFQYITWPVSIALIAYFMRPIWSSLSTWFQRQPNNSRIDNLEGFREDLENNHFHDIQEVKDSVKQINRDLIEIREDVGDLKGRIIRVETKINDHHSGGS